MQKCQVRNGEQLSDALLVGSVQQCLQHIILITFTSIYGSTAIIDGLRTDVLKFIRHNDYDTLDLNSIGVSTTSIHARAHSCMHAHTALVS